MCAAVGGAIGSGKHRTGQGIALGGILGILGIIVLIFLKRRPKSAITARFPQSGDWHSDPTGRNEYRMRIKGQWTQTVSNDGVVGIDSRDLPDLPLA